MEEMLGLLSGSHIPCPPLPGLMEKSISASQCFVSSAGEVSQQDRHRAAAFFSRALETEPLTEASCFLQGARIWPFAISLPSSLNGPEPACFHDYVFEQKHICVRGSTRRQWELSAWIFVDLPSRGLEGQGREWGCRPFSVGCCGQRCPSSGTVVGPAHQRPVWMGLQPQPEASSFPQKPKNKENLNNPGKLLYRKIFQLNKKSI